MPRHSFLVASCFLGLAAPLLAAPIPIGPVDHPGPVDFEREVLPILRASCLACHNSRHNEANLSLESPAAILQGGDQGPAVIAGKPAESLLLKVAAHQEESFMPPAENQVGAKPLTPPQLGLIRLWIEQGGTGAVSSQRPIAWQPIPVGMKSIFAVAVSNDGQTAVASRANELHVYDLPAGKLAAQLVDPALSGVAAHQDFVRSLAFNRSGQWLASGAFGEVKLWRRPIAAKSAEWMSESAPSALATSSDGVWIATGDDTGQIRLHSPSDGKLLRKIAAHAGHISALVFSPDSAAVYSTGHDKKLRVWKVADGAPVGSPVELSVSLQSLALLKAGEWLLGGAADGIVRVWETKDLAQPPREIQAHTGALTALAAIADQPGEFLSGGEDGVVRRFDAESGRKVREWPLGAPVASLAASSSGERIAAAGGGKVRLWEGQSEKLVAELATDPRHATRIAQLDAEIALAKSAADLAQRDIKSYEGTERRVGVTEMDVKKAEEEKVKAEKARDEKQAAIAKAGDDAKKKEAAEKAAADAETAVAVAQTVIDRAQAVAEKAAQAFAAAKADLAIREERVKSLAAAKASAVLSHKQHVPNARHVAFTTDGQQLVAGTEDGAVYLLAAGTGQPFQSLAEHSAPIVGLAGIGDSQLVSVSSDKRVVVFDAPSEWRLARTISAATTAGAPVDRVLALDFSPDGQFLATGGGLASRSGELKIWSVADGRLVREIPAHDDTIFAVRFAPAGPSLATGAADRLVKIIDWQTGETRQVLAGHTAHVLGVAWKADGQRLVSCGGDQVLKLWDASAGVPLLTMKGTSYKIGAYKREVTSLAFLGASEQYVAASGDGTIRLHRTTSDGEILVYAGAKGHQHAVAATPAGEFIVAGGADGVLRVWSGQNSSARQSLDP
ncbi:MAG: c-type cytochrome domain-containing protein [Pirellulaceae bacterium]|nr:c-type cytochrome domain-containing protein [Pirellulaceae bacterium]